MSIIEPFEKYTSEYEKWFENNNYAYLSELEAVKKLLPKKGKGLEIGVGTGRFAAPLEIQFGVEPSASMRKIAELRGVQTTEGVAEELHFPDTHFDYVLMVTTICFFDDIKASFTETYRILKPNGHIVIGFIDKTSFTGREYQNHKQQSKFFKKANFYSTEEVVEALKDIGFENFRYVQTIFKNLPDINRIEPVKQGFGLGLFAVIRGQK